MAVRVEPVYLQAGTVLLAAPAPAALYVENVHVDATALRCQYILGSGGPFFENVIVDCVYGPERFSGYIGVWHTDTKRFFHAYHQLQRVNRIQAKSILAEQCQVIADLLRSNLQHKIFHEHLLDLDAQIRLRHKRAAILP